MLYIRYLDIFHLITGSLYNFSHPHNHQFTVSMTSTFYIPHIREIIQCLSLSVRPSSFSLYILSLGNIILTCSFSYNLYAYEYQFACPSQIFQSSTTLLLPTLNSLLVHSKGTPNMPIQNRPHRLPTPTSAPPQLLLFPCSLYL